MTRPPSRPLAQLSNAYLCAGLCLYGAASLAPPPTIAAPPRLGASKTPDAPVRVIYSDGGYTVKMTFDQHLAFPGTNLVFEGVVERVGRPKYVNNRGFELVYAPVQVRVLRWFRGPRPASAHVTLRALGGVADGVEFRGDLVSGEAVKKRETRILVFANTPVVTYGDTIAATTPNAVFVRDGDELADVTTRNPGTPVVTRVTVAYARNVLGAPVL